MRLASALFAAAVLLGVAAPHAPARAQALNCEYGPVQREYGAQYWKVFACDDDKSVILVAGQGNRATPYVFTFSPSQTDPEAYVLTGKGAGDPTYVGKARVQLEALRPGQVRDLYKAARAKGNGE